jgi:hypothetical protein
MRHIAAGATLSGGRSGKNLFQSRISREIEERDPHPAAHGLRGARLYTQKKRGFRPGEGAGQFADMRRSSQFLRRVSAAKMVVELAVRTECGMVSHCAGVALFGAIIGSHGN